MLEHGEEFSHTFEQPGIYPFTCTLHGSAGGHGGMDFVMRWRIVQCLREGRPLDQSVYDGCAWSVIGPLSEQSVAQGGMPIEVPDFTRGAWQTAAPVDIKV